jgi:DNA-directed RNA polymerase alpha subunit
MNAVDRKLKELNLSTRAFNCLKLAGIKSESEIKSKINELHIIEGMGKKTLEEVKSVIESQD